ncbi:hypothetical protein [Paenibacillus eucommiae]|uniref:Uncharacterized protein n=1 Tax=Paenibacillus eucommiae TaxID=1355755 RepID=A0ABS4ITR0_9BACL|nr:hypothetical protein [Paenibacillus eucommiae]MBP1990968.1 hypothetical protein [Paenibacillus eucommiae]
MYEIYFLSKTAFIAFILILLLTAACSSKPPGPAEETPRPDATKSTGTSKSPEPAQEVKHDPVKLKLARSRIVSSRLADR